MRKQAQPTMAAAPQAIGTTPTMLSAGVTRPGAGPVSKAVGRARAVGTAAKGALGRAALPLGAAAGGLALGTGAYMLGKKILGKKEQAKAASVMMSGFADEFFHIKQAAVLTTKAREKIKGEESQKTEKAKQKVQMFGPGTY